MLISDSVSTVNYSDTIRSKIATNSSFLEDDAWIQFLLDHREYIRERSTITTLDEKTMNRYRYRIRDFLQDTDGTSADCEQAFKIINRLGSNLDFNDSLRAVYVPPTNVVKEIRNSYYTCQQQLNKLNITL